MKRNVTRSILMAAVALALMFYNMTNIVGSECIRAIHVVTLMVAGAAAYILIVNVIALIKGNK